MVILCIFCYINVFLLLCIHTVILCILIVIYSHGYIMYYYVMYSYCNVYVFLLLCIFCSVYSVSLCRSMYCLCVNVYCSHRVTTQLQLTNMPYHKGSEAHKLQKLVARYIFLGANTRITHKLFADQQTFCTTPFRSTHTSHPVS